MINSACLPSVNAHNVMRSNGRITFALIAVIIRKEKSWQWWKRKQEFKTCADLVFDIDFLIVKNEKLGVGR